MDPPLLSLNDKSKWIQHNFMLGWPCISIYMNINQLDALFLKNFRVP
jgi:hypothetical protein